MNQPARKKNNSNHDTVNIFRVIIRERAKGPDIIKHEHVDDEDLTNLYKPTSSSVKGYTVLKLFKVIKCAHVAKIK